jgi:hypothetical protein
MSTDLDLLGQMVIVVGNRITRGGGPDTSGPAAAQATSPTATGAASGLRSDRHPTPDQVKPAGPAMRDAAPAAHAARPDGVELEASAQATP